MANDIGSYTNSPSGFMRYAFPWGTGELANHKGPRDWQEGINQHVEQWFSNPETKKQPCMIAVASGHGIGKSAEVGMLIGWAMSTCEDCKVVVTAGTGAQLSTKTVPEVSKWFRMLVNTDWWDVQAQSIKFKSAKFDKTWRTDFITWSEQKSEAFAGMHNMRKRVVLIFDEASQIADIIWEVAEGAMTDEDTEIIWIAFGNPTRNTGRFKECYGKFKHRWKTFQIDSRTVEGTNKEQIQKWIEDYGEDSDFVRVRVKGEFPRAATNQFIPSDIVATARKHLALAYEGLPKVLICDPARFGDDLAPIGWRQGRKFVILHKLRNISTDQLAMRMIEEIEIAKREGKPYDAWIVDGDGIGAGVCDHLVMRGYGPKVDGTPGLFEFHGGSSAKDQKMYFNRRAEVWGAAREWLKNGADIPDDPELETDLCGVEYGFSKDNQIQLEKKEDMKARGLSSPDLGDLLAMSFEVQIQKKPKLAKKPTSVTRRAWS